MRAARPGEEGFAPDRTFRNGTHLRNDENVQWQKTVDTKRTTEAGTSAGLGRLEKRDPVGVKAMPKRRARKRFRPNAAGVAPKEQSCTEVLPYELWDMILNGTDAAGVPFLHACERFLARPVCRLWHRVVGEPGTRPHIESTWLSGEKEGLADATAFRQGRAVTLTGIACFLFPTDAQRRALPLPPPPTTVERSRIRARLKAFSSTFALDMRIQWQRYKINLFVNTLAGGRCIDDGSYVSGIDMTFNVIITLMHLSSRDSLVTYLNTHVRWNACRPMDEIVRVALYARGDQPGLCVHLMALDACMSVIHAEHVVSRTARRIWKVLAETASLGSIRALVDLLASDTPHPEHQRWVHDAAALLDKKTTSLYAKDDRWAQTMMRERDSGAFLSGGQPLDDSWATVAVSCADPVGVLEAHGMVPAHVRDVLYTALLEERWHVADAVHARALRDNPTMDLFYARGEGRASLPDILHAALARGQTRALHWLAAHDYAPTLDHTHLLFCVRRSDGSYGTYNAKVMRTLHMIDAILLVARLWPEAVVGCPRAVVAILRKAIKVGFWAKAANLIRALFPIFTFDTMQRVAAEYRAYLVLAEGDAVDDAKGVMPADALYRFDDRTLWQAIVTKRLRAREGRNALDDPVDTFAFVDYGTSRMGLLLALADRYDPAKSDADMAAAWRFWCGEPLAVETSPKEQAIITAARRGLFVPSALSRPL